MKKMIAFIFVVVILVGLAFVKIEAPNNIDYEKMVIVSSYKLDLKRQGVQNGKDFYYTFDRAEKQDLQIDYNKVKGVVYYISKSHDLSYFGKKFNYNFYKGHDVDGKEIYYGYDKTYYDFRVIDDKKVNFQLVNDEDYWILGYPMILTAF